MSRMKSSINQAVLVEALEPPLWFRRELLASKYILKNKCDDLLMCKIYNIFINNLSNSYRKKKIIHLHSVLPINIVISLSSEIEYNYLFLKPIIHIPVYPQDEVSVYNTFYEYLSKIPSNAIKIFTYGSKTDEKLSGAFYVQSIKLEYSFTLNSLLRIFSAEAAAISHAMEWAIAKQASEVVICSDSQPVLKRLCKFPRLIVFTSNPWS